MFDYKAPGRPYFCDIYNEEYFFLHPSINDGKILGKVIPKLYKKNAVDDDGEEIAGEYDRSDVEPACYLYMRCDEDGNQLFPDFKKTKEYRKEIEKLSAVQRFNEHLIGVTNFLAGVGENDQLVSDMEGTIDHAKKKS